MSLLECPTCRELLASGAAFCGGCGHRFELPAAPEDRPSCEQLSGDARVLASSHAWHATPWDYGSLRALMLLGDGSGDMVYGYGQTIYAEIRCRWEVLPTGVLRLTYLSSPGFEPIPGDRGRELGYTLTEGQVSGIESIVGFPYRYLWTLELSECPWPRSVEWLLEEKRREALVRHPESERWTDARFKVPLTFYGHRTEGAVEGQRGRLVRATLR
jgi:hypothetical protein